MVDSNYFDSCYFLVIEPVGLQPRSATLHQFKFKAGINGAPTGYPRHLFRFDLELVTLRAKEVTVFCI